MAEQFKSPGKRTLAVVFFILFLSSAVSSQTCNCSENLDTLIAKTERNYAGFPLKVKSANKAAYQSLTKNLRSRAGNVSAPKACFYLLREYVRYFYDSHFQLNYYDENDFDKEIIQLSETSLKKKLEVSTRKALEGIWINQDSSLKLGILSFPNEVYKAIVLEAKDTKLAKGLVYMTIKTGKRGLTVNYYNSFAATNYPIKQRGNLLQGWSDELFGRIYPIAMTEKERKEQATWLNYRNGLDCYRLSPKTVVLKVPSFANNDDKIASLVQQNDSLIRSTENLIVDLTGNSGGSTGWVSFLGYFMTKPIVQQNGFVRVSPENVKSKMADIEPYVANPIPADYLKYFPDSVLSQYKKAAAELPTTKKSFYPVPGVVFPLDSITRNPQKIALVVDELCGSSTEYFFFLSRASGKLTSYGVNTFGMMDYEGTSSTELPYAKFRVAIPIVKSSWTDKQPIDKTGFSPTRQLGKIPPENWLEHIRKELEK